MKLRWCLVVLCACSSSPRTAVPTPPIAAPAGRLAGAAARPAPPHRDDPAPARREPFVETVHGTQVRDPYRWMETDAPAFAAFLADQAAYAHRTLAAIPGRDQLRDAIHTANHGVTRIEIAGVTGPLAHPRVFLWKRAPDDDTAQIFVRDGWTGTDRLLVDPRTRGSGGAHAAIDYAEPSPDGKHLAYGISSSGSEDSTIEILDVDRGTLLPEKIDRAQYAGVTWRDDRSFFHWRRRAPAPGDTPADWFKHSASYLHVLGDDPEKAQPIFGPAMAALGLAAEDFSHIRAAPGSRWAVAGASPGTSADFEYFVAPLGQLAPGRTPWRRLSGPSDHVTGMITHGDTVYALSYAGAPRYRILALDAARGTLATARVFVAESAAVLEDFVGASDAMYLQLFDGGSSRIERITYDGKQRTAIPLPFPGAASIAGSADRPGIELTLEGWTHPPADFQFVPGAGPNAGLRPLALREPWPIDYAHLTAEDVEVTSADGTRVPMSIVRRADTPLDGSAPGLVEGYQAYGEVSRPFFWAISLTWSDRGGVYATCHGRGSGNRGKPWHEAGIKHNKERGIEDFIACAEYLVAHKYTAAARLTVTGTSAGGMIAGGAVTRRPDLYAAALLRVPMVNPVRFETTEGGPANVPELGSLADPDDFHALLAVDAYHRVTDGTKYPAIVVTGGTHDVRVPVWGGAKLVARVQAATTSGRPVLLRVEADAGHGFGSTRTQLEEEYADLYAFALWQSGVPVAR